MAKILTYISVCTLPYACAVTTVSRNLTSGEYFVSKLWELNYLSYDKIIVEIVESLKNKRIPSEDIEKYFYIISKLDGFLEHKILNIKVDCEYKYIISKIPIEMSLEIMCGLVNDEKVKYKNPNDATKVKSEVRKLNAETMKNLSPILQTLSLSIGEAELRKLCNHEYIPSDIEVLDVATIVERRLMR